MRNSIFLALLGLLGPSAAFAQQVTFQVEVPHCTPLGAQVMLRSNRLDPAAVQHDPLTRVDRTHFRGTFEVRTDRARFGYRYSLGTCDTTACPGIEKAITFNGSGAEVADRTLQAGTSSTADYVFIWRNAIDTFDQSGQPTGIRTDAQRVAFCGPYLSVSSEEGAITVGYDAWDGGDVTLEYGETEALGQMVSGSGAHRNKMRLSGLSPGQRYFYRVREDGVLGGEGSFIAPVISGQPFRFAFIGDTQYYGEQQRIDAGRVIGLVRDFDPHLVISPGDLVASERDANGWMYPEMGRFNLIFGQLAPLISRAPLMVAMGNHEEDAPYYWDVFDFPRPDAPALDHYWFKYGNVLFVALYTGRTDGYDLDGILNSQTFWLRDVLQEAANDPDIRWRVLYLHRGAFSQGANHPTDGYDFWDGGNAGRPSWGSIAEQYGVDLVLAGHNHNFTLAENNGIRYVTSCGGAPTHDLLQPMRATTLYAERTCSADFFEVGPKTISFSAKRPDGTQIDRGSFALCKEHADCSELPNPCPQAVSWSCTRPVCRSECSSYSIEVSPPDPLRFRRVIGGRDATPARRTIHVAAGQPIIPELTCHGSWLVCSTRPGEVVPLEATFSVSPAIELEPGTYTASVTIGVSPNVATPIVLQASLEVVTSTIVTPNRPPGAPSLISPIDDIEVEGPAVELVAGAATDPDGHPLRYEIELFRSGGTAPVELWQDLEPSGDRVTVATPKLASDRFEWRARARDSTGASGPWTSRAAFRVAGEAAVEEGGCSCQSSAPPPPRRRGDKWAALGSAMLGVLGLLLLIRRWTQRTRLPPK